VVCCDLPLGALLSPARPEKYPPPPPPPSTDLRQL